MKLESLRLTQFRNFEGVEFSPDPQLNFLVGANAQGKTSILEAIGLLSSLDSFRGAKSPELLRWNQPMGKICGQLCGQLSSPPSSPLSTWQVNLDLEFRYENTKLKKIAAINGKPYRSSAAYLKQRFQKLAQGFHSVVFNPSDHELVRGEPRLRRLYLNRCLSAEDPDYLVSLKRYQKVLEQRNTLLKSMREADVWKKSGQNVDFTMLEALTDQLASLAAELVQKRLVWIKCVNLLLNPLKEEIAPTQLPLEMVYLSKWAKSLSSVPTNIASPPEVAELQESLRTEFRRLQGAELASGVTLVGAHRDDWGFRLGEQWLKGHGSQGEIRSALLCLKLAELQKFQDTTETRPVFLLDDFSSELDQSRRKFLLALLEKSELQVFVTTTDARVFSGIRFQVESGKVTPQEPSIVDSSSVFPSVQASETL